MIFSLRQELFTKPWTTRQRHANMLRIHSTVNPTRQSLKIAKRATRNSIQLKEHEATKCNSNNTKQLNATHTTCVTQVPQLNSTI